MFGLVGASVRSGVEGVHAACPSANLRTAGGILCVDRGRLPLPLLAKSGRHRGLPRESALPPKADIVTEAWFLVTVLLVLAVFWPEIDRWFCSPSNADEVNGFGVQHAKNQASPDARRRWCIKFPAPHWKTKTHRRPISVFGPERTRDRLQNVVAVTGRSPSHG